MRVTILTLVGLAIVTAASSGYPAGGHERAQLRWASRMATPPPGSLEIGLLLLAIDVQRDHVRVSEGMRVSNPGPPVTREVRVALPPGAVYATFHRGLRSPGEMAGGFADVVRFQTGITELAYSYALPAARELNLTRVFPFRARRIEVIVRGPGVALAVRGGAALPPLRLGDQELLRWELRDVPAGSPVTMMLRGLPVTRSWIPAAVAGALAVVLGAGLIVALRRRESTGSTESPGS